MVQLLTKEVLGLCMHNKSPTFQFLPKAERQIFCIQLNYYEHGHWHGHGHGRGHWH